MNLRRVLGVTGIVAALGAAGGALGGMMIAAMLGLLDLADGGSSLLSTLGLFGRLALGAGAMGAAAGSILGPVFAWSLLRRAPLWRAIGETAFAAALGVGLVLGSGVQWPWNDWLVLWSATLASSGIAATRLRLELTRKARHLAASSAGRSGLVLLAALRFAFASLPSPI